MILSLILIIFYLFIILIFFKNSNNKQQKYLSLATILLNTLFYWYMFFKFKATLYQYIIILLLLCIFIFLIFKLPKKLKIQLLVFNMYFIILCSTMFLVNLYRIKQNKTPIFYFQYNSYQDGGSIEYLSLGYKILKQHKIIAIDTYSENTYIYPFAVTYQDLSINSNNKTIILID